MVHLDSDSLVIGSLAPLLRLNLAATPLWAALRAPRPASAAPAAESDPDTRLDTGALVLRPDAEEFARLTARAGGPSAAAQPAEEEGLRRLLAGVFWGRRGDLDVCADAAGYARDPAEWGRLARTGALRVVRYAELKPWACDAEAEGAGGPCRAWRASEGRVRCGLTLVTAYWDIPSKFSAEQYREWMQVVGVLEIRNSGSYRNDIHL